MTSRICMAVVRSTRPATTGTRVLYACYWLPGPPPHWRTTKAVAPWTGRQSRATPPYARSSRSIRTLGLRARSLWPLRPAGLPGPAHSQQRRSLCLVRGRPKGVLPLGSGVLIGSTATRRAARTAKRACSSDSANVGAAVRFGIAPRSACRTTGRHTSPSVTRRRWRAPCDHRVGPEPEQGHRAKETNST